MLLNPSDFSAPPTHLARPPIQALRTIYDPYNDEEITLSKEELGMIMRIRKGQFPSLEVGVCACACARMWVRSGRLAAAPCIRGCCGGRSAVRAAGR